MLTFFTTAKPFLEHSAIIQRNALKSWTLLHPEVEVILFGDDAGVAETARELGIRHESILERNAHGTHRIDGMFARAQAIARHDLLCYINCDIILLPEFCEALKRVRNSHGRFLMLGRRWDAAVTERLDFGDPAWGSHVKSFARQHGIEQPAWSIDYFAFPRGLYPEIPPFGIGRLWWDQWLIWKARKERADVVDVSSVVTAVHQNHDYNHHAQGRHGVWHGQEQQHNLQLAGGPWHLFTIDDATHALSADGERRNPKRFWMPYWRFLRPIFIPIWFAILDLTRPLRSALGLRAPALRGSGEET
jgi:hypothetical protein